MSEGRPATPPTNPETLSPVQNTQTNRPCQRGGQRHRLPTRRLGALSKTHKQTGRVRGEASDTAYQPGDSEPCPKHTDTDKQTVSEGRPVTPPTNPETRSPVQNTHTDKQAVSEGRPATPPTNPETRSPVQNTHTQTNRPCQRGGQRHRLPTRRLGDLSKTHRQTGRVRGEASDTAYQPGDSEPCPKHTDKQIVSEGRPATPPTNPQTRSPVQNTHTDKQTVSEGRPATPPTNPETLSPVQNTQTNRPCQRGGQRHRLPTRRLGALSKTHTQTNRPCQRGGQRHRLPTRRL